MSTLREQLEEEIEKALAEGAGADELKRIVFQQRIKRGIWSNGMGRIRVTGPVIGDSSHYFVWRAADEEPLFKGQLMYISETFLRDCGYEWVSELPEDE